MSNWKLEIGNWTMPFISCRAGGVVTRSASQPEGTKNLNTKAATGDGERSTKESERGRRNHEQEWIKKLPKCLAATGLLLAVMVASGRGAETNPAPVRVAAGDVVKGALLHNEAVHVAAEEVRAAEARLDQAAATAWPTVKLEARAAMYDGLEDSVLGPGIVIPGIENRHGASAVLSQPIFNGGAILSQKAQARHQQESAAAVQQATTADVRLLALRSYWEWAKAFHSLAAFQAAVARLESHAKDMRNRFEAKSATDNDLLSAEVRLDETRLQLDEATRRVAVARARIVWLTGAELPGGAVPGELGAENATLEMPGETECLQAAESGRAERAARRAEAAGAEAAERAARADYWPKVNLSAAYEAGNPNSLFFPPEETWNEDMFVGVTASWNILDWGLTRGKVAEASARRRQAEWRLSQTERQIALEVKEARANLANAGQRLAVSLRMEKSARRNMEVSKDLFDSKMVRHSELLDAMSRLTDAEYAVIAARADQELARAAMEHALGEWSAE